MFGEDGRSSLNSSGRIYGTIVVGEREWMWSTECDRYKLGWTTGRK